MRKRVIKILKDICIECPDFPKIPEICVKMIRRVNDEDGKETSYILVYACSFVGYVICDY